MAKHCNGWCWPAIIYVVLAAISLSLNLLENLSSLDKNDAHKIKLFHVLFHLVWVGLWTALFYWLCSNCHNTAAWIVLLLPVILGIIILFLGSALITVFMLQKVAVKESLVNYTE